MKISLKQYEYEKVQIADKEIELPDTTVYYFQTGIRRAIRIVPLWTTWNKENYGKDEFIYEFEITCVYSSMECMIDKFKIPYSNIEGLYYSDNNNKYNNRRDLSHFVKSWINGDFNVRTKEDFEADLHFIIDNL